MSRHVVTIGRDLPYRLPVLYRIGAIRSNCAPINVLGGGITSVIVDVRHGFARTWA